MKFDLRLIVVVGANMLLFFGVHLINSLLASSALYIFIPALFIITPVLLFPHHWVLITMAIQGLFIDSLLSTLPSGYSLIFLSTASTLLFYFRNPLIRSSGKQILIATQGINGILFIAHGLIFNQGLWQEPTYWLRLTADITASQFFLFFITIMFINLQKQIIWQIGLDPTGEEVQDI